MGVVDSLLKTFLGPTAPLRIVDPAQDSRFSQALRAKTLGPLLRQEGEIRERMLASLDGEAAAVLGEEAGRLRELIGVLRPRNPLSPPSQWLADANDLYGPLIAAEGEGRLAELELRKMLQRDLLLDAIEEGRAREALSGRGRFYNTASSFSRHHTLISSLRDRFQEEGRSTKGIAVVGAGRDHQRNETYEVFEWAAQFPEARVSVFDRHEAIPEIVNGSSPSFVTVHPAFLDAFPHYGDYLAAFGMSPDRLRQEGFRFQIPLDIKARSRAQTVQFLSDPFPSGPYDIVSFLMTYVYLFGRFRDARKEIMPRVFLLELFDSLAPNGILVMDAQMQPPFSSDLLKLLGLRSWTERHEMVDVEKAVPVPAAFNFYRKIEDSDLLKEICEIIRKEFQRGRPLLDAIRAEG